MKGRNGRRVSACQSHLREKAQKNDFFFFVPFSHHLRGFERNRRRIRQKMKKLGGCIRNEEGWTAELRMANYFTPLVSPEGFPGSEVQPSWNAEDCIKLNCAVVFYTIVNCGILEKAWGTWRELFLLRRLYSVRQSVIPDDSNKQKSHFNHVSAGIWLESHQRANRGETLEVSDVKLPHGQIADKDTHPLIKTSWCLL